MGGSERRGTTLALFGAFVGCTVAAVLTRDHGTLSGGLIAVAVAAMLATAVHSRAARAASDLPRWRSSATSGGPATSSA